MKLKELIIISVCLVIPLIFSIFLEMNFFITVFASLSISAIGLYLLKKNKFAGKLLAAASTLGIFMAVGNTVYWILNSIIMIAMMYFYVTTDNIEDILFKIIVLLSTITLVGMWNNKMKEGFTISNLRTVSNSMTTKECQDYCEKTKQCKYAETPPLQKKGNCKISSGINQYVWGYKSSNLWKNKNYIRVNENDYGSYYTTSRSAQTKNIKTVNINMIPKIVRLEGEVGDQGWGNRTRGLYIRGYRGNNTIFSESLVAPRTRGYKLISGEWDINPNNLKIDKIKCFIYSRGSGHSIRAKNVSFTVIGSK